MYAATSRQSAAFSAIINLPIYVAFTDMALCWWWLQIDTRPRHRVKSGFIWQCMVSDSPTCPFFMIMSLQGGLSLCLQLNNHTLSWPQTSTLYISNIILIVLNGLTLHRKMNYHGFKTVNLSNNECPKMTHWNLGSFYTITKMFKMWNGELAAKLVVVCNQFTKNNKFIQKEGSSLEVRRGAWYGNRRCLVWGIMVGYWVSWEPCLPHKSRLVFINDYHTESKYTEGPLL